MLPVKICDVIKKDKTFHKTIHIYFNVNIRSLYGSWSIQKVKNANMYIVTYVMLREFALYCAKRVHSSTEMRPYNFRLSWRLINHQGCASSSRSVPRTCPDRCAWGVFLDLDEYGVEYQLRDAILIHFLALIRSSLF